MFAFTAKEILQFSFLPLALISIATVNLVISKIAERKLNLEKSVSAIKPIPLNLQSCSFLLIFWSFVAFHPVIFHFKSLWNLWAIEFTHTDLGVLFYEVVIIIVAILALIAKCLSISPKSIIKKPSKAVIFQLMFFPIALWALLSSLILNVKMDALTRSAILVFFVATVSFAVGMWVNRAGNFFKENAVLISTSILVSVILNFFAFISEISLPEVDGDAGKWLFYRHGDLVSHDNATAEIALFLVAISLVIFAQTFNVNLKNHPSKSKSVSQKALKQAELRIAKTEIFEVTEAKIVRKTCVISIAFASLETLLTWSRTGLIALFLLLLGFAFFSRKSINFVKLAVIARKISKSVISKVISVFALFAAVALLIVSVPHFVSRFSGENYDEIRPQLVSMALTAFKDNFLFGVGLNRFLPNVEAKNPFLGLVYANPVHNSFLTIAVDLGFVGLLLFFIPLFIIFAKSIRTSKNRCAFDNIILSLFAPVMLTMFFDFGLTNEFKFSMFLFILGLFFSGSLSKNEENEIISKISKTALGINQRFTARKTALLLSLTLIIVFSLSFVFSKNSFQNNDNTYAQYEMAQAGLSNDYYIDVSNSQSILAKPTNSVENYFFDNQHASFSQFLDKDPETGDIVHIGEKQGEWTYDWFAPDFMPFEENSELKFENVIHTENPIHRLMFRTSAISWVPLNDFYFSGNGAEYFGLKPLPNRKIMITHGYLEKELNWFEPLNGGINLIFTGLESDMFKSIAFDTKTNTIAILSPYSQKIIYVPLSLLSDKSLHKEKNPYIKESTVESEPNDLFNYEASIYSIEFSDYDQDTNPQINDIKFVDGKLLGLGPNGNVFELSLKQDENNED